MMNQQNTSPNTALPSTDMPWSVMICLLGHFRLIVHGVLIPVRAGGKSETFLSLLALSYHQRVSREYLLQSLWPESTSADARNSLHNLVHHVNKLLGPALQGASAVLQADGYYRLNSAAGIGVDLIYFDQLIARGNQQLRAGDLMAAFQAFDHAVQLYRDDLQLAGDSQTIIERERLRASYLTILAQLAEYHYQAGDYTAALAYLWRLLARDPYREDAHRLIMRSYMQRGERATALHQYQVCTEMLRTEFDALPETATTSLFNQIRNAPEQIK